MASCAIRPLTLTFDLDLQSQESCGYDPYTCKTSRFKSEGGNGWTDEGDRITSHANAVSKYSLVDLTGNRDNHDKCGCYDNIRQEGLAVASIARDDPSTLPGNDPSPRAH